MWIEGIGLLAGVIIYGSMLFKDLILIKACLLAAAVCFLSYSLLLILPAMIIVNSVGIIIGTYGLRKAIKSRRRK